ncbi:MAG: hypothetical protein L6Q99_06950 [Planctomycetes bacterium]|nr:hypothetical protein [Planctomycetota bacterium]
MKRLLGSVSFVVAAIACWLLFARDDAGVASVVPAPSSSAATDEPDARAALTVPTPSRDSERASVAGVASNSVGVGAARDAATLPVLVVDANTQRPVANADVFSVEIDPDWQALELARREPGALLEWLGTHARRTVTDERGGTRVPRARVQALIAARAGERFTSVAVGPQVENVVLAFGDEYDFDVHVVHADGRDAAELEVELRSLDHFGLRTQAKTDEHGVARFRHVRPFMRADVAEPCEVTVRALLRDRPIASFASLAEIPKQFELMLPSCGAIEVTLVDANDVVWVGETAFIAGIVTDDFVTQSLAWTNAYAKQGVVRLEPIEIATECEFSAWSTSPILRAQARLAAPKRAGETTHVRLTLAPLPAAIFRAVDERGVVLAKQDLVMNVRELGGAWGDGDPWSVTLTTDANGEFRVPYRDSDPDDERLRNVDCFTTRATDGSELCFHVELDSGPVTEDRRCGDARFVPTKLIVAGRVLDERGEPAEGIAIRLDEFHGGMHGGGGGAQDGASELRGDDGWREHPAWPVTDARGQFSIRGVSHATRLRVVANRGRTNESAPVLCVVGTSDVELVVTRPGKFVGSLRVPPLAFESLPRVHWSGRTFGDDRAISADVVVQAAPEPGLFTFEFVELAAGTGTVSITVGPREVVRVEDVVVVPGETTRDPRLQQLDLFAGQRELVVRVYLPDGSACANGLVRTTSLDEPERRADWQIRRGEARCLVGAGPVDLWVAARGARRETVRSVAMNEHSVTLRPPLELELVFRAAGLPAHLIARLECPGENPVIVTEIRAAGGDATLRTSFDAQGRCRVVLFAVLPGERADVRRLGEWPIEVADVDELQKFEFELDAHVLETVLR